MPPEPVDRDEAEFPLLIELEKALGFVAFALNGEGGLLFAGSAELRLSGVIFPELLGVVMPTAEEPPLLALLPRGTKSVLEPTADGEPSDFPAVSSMGAGIVVL